MRFTLNNLSKIMLCGVLTASVAAISQSQAAEITLTAAHTLNETHPTHLAIAEMADLINKNS